MRLIPLDEPPAPCGYFPGEQAQYESFVLVEATDLERDVLLQRGFRWFGTYTFRPKDVAKGHCVPLRVPIATFSPTKSQRRAMKKCRDIRVEVMEPTYTKEKFEIYVEHMSRFSDEVAEVNEDNFVASFYDTRVPAFEFLYYLGDKLTGFGIVARSENAFSSVYFCYRLDYSALSLGTYSLLQEIEQARDMGLDYLYLGYYIRDNRFMEYKRRFYPNEVLTSDEKWVPFVDMRGESLLDEPLTFTPKPLFQ